ncbi:response regulator [Serratia ureilytica]|uniref:response regulator n=1 Tax=Serratia ureilytica TaxID=300181 RepID=UPI00313CB8C3
MLLVDDVTMNRDIMKRILSGLGHQVELSGSGFDIGSRPQRVYDVVIMDLPMPEMGGFETTRRWRDAGSGMLDKDPLIIALWRKLSA